MNFDDDDGPALVSAAVSSLSGETGDDALTAEDALEDEAQDFRLFANTFCKKSVSAQKIRKGEKDFESYGTQLQQTALAQSRQAMQDVLSYTRVHMRQSWARAWYFPDWWAAWSEKDENEPSPVSRQSHVPERTYPTLARDRVVVVEGSHAWSKNMGRAIRGQVNKPAKGRDWLLPEEALFLVERGSLDLWWPTRGLEHVFPSEGNEVVVGSNRNHDSAADELDEYELGFPLTLEAAYALLIGKDGDRGKISLQKYQVYAHLKRAGYNLLRSPPRLPPSAFWIPPSVYPEKNTLWEWLTSRLARVHRPSQAAYGPLVKPGLYRSYNPIYQQLALLSRHRPSPYPSSAWVADGPFSLQFHVWKSGTTFIKTRPCPPDCDMAVVDAQDTSVPDLEQIVALLDTTPWSPPNPDWAGPGRLYQRIRNGFRNVLIAVVDHGVINYMRFAEGTFGTEPLYPDFDRRGTQRGGKMGGGNRGGNKSENKGGTGRGRGRRGRR